MDPKIADFVDAEIPKLVDAIVSLAEVPTPTGDEVRRAQAVRDLLQRWRMKAHFDDVGNLWVGWPEMPTLAVPDRPLVVITAHLDTVFPWEINWAVERHEKILRGPGVADNAAGLAVLVWLAKYLKYKVPDPRNQYLLVGTVGQVVSLTGIHVLLDALRNAGLDPTRFLHVEIEGSDLGQVTVGGVGARRYEVKIQTLGGHSWIDAGVPNAIHIAAGLICKLYHEIPQEPGKTTYNVGTIEGGTAINAVAPHVKFACEFRSTDPAEIRRLESQAMKTIQEAAQNPAVTVETRVIGERPASTLHADFPVVNIVRAIHADLGIEPRVKYGSGDANYPLSVGLQSVALGCTRAFQIHTVSEWLQVPPLRTGLAQFCSLVESLERAFPGAVPAAPDWDTKPPGEKNPS